MQSKNITSSDNPQFKALRKLATSSRERRKSGKTLLDGVHLLQALRQRGGEIESLVVDEQQANKAEIQSCISQFDVPVVHLAHGLFSEISPVDTPSGIMGVYKTPQPSKESDGFVVLLENLQDPGNLGSILRSAAAAGVNGIYLSKGCAEAWSPKALRAGMGAHFFLSIYEQQDLVELSTRIGKVVATRLDATKSIFDIDLTEDFALLFGNEGAGVSEVLSSVCSEQVHIPMPGQTESLNVAAAVAICLFERVRQLSATDR